MGENYPDLHITLIMFLFAVLVIPTPRFFETVLYEIYLFLLNLCNGHIYIYKYTYKNG